MCSWKCVMHRISFSCPWVTIFLHSRVKLKTLTTSHQGHGQLKENLFLPLLKKNLHFKILQNYRFDNMRGKARDILILQRITDFSTTGSAVLKRCNNGKNFNREMYNTQKRVNVSVWFGSKFYFYNRKLLKSFCI